MPGCRNQESCFSRAHAVAQRRAEHLKWQIQLEGWHEEMLWCPLSIKLFLLILHTCNFDTDMNYNVNTGVF